VDTRYTRDTAGNPLTARDAIASRTITATYDPLNRPLNVSGDAAGDPATTYGYQLKNATRFDASGTYTATLDDYGRESALIDPINSGDKTYSFVYAASGALAWDIDPEGTTANGNTTTNTYDPLGRLHEGDVEPRIIHAHERGGPLFP
jgi:hypothetical protein